jgi:hypothetical protein
MSCAWGRPAWVAAILAVFVLAFVHPQSTLALPVRPSVGICDGVVVRRGSDLERVMAREPAGATFCLGAGTFLVSSTIFTDVGDRLIGAGSDATFIDGSGLPETAVGIFGTSDANYFADFDISGAPTPTVESGVFCGTETAPFKSNCGKAFSIVGSSLTIESVNCHDNGGNCIGGGGSANVTVDNLDCWGNGNAYSMNSSFRYAACIKRAAVYEPGGDTTVTNSYIHDNAWVGIWCDYCKYGLFDIENNRIIRNGAAGVQWEMSGGWTEDDRAVIRDNVFRDNNYVEKAAFRGGIAISTANDIIVSGNTFGGNTVAGVNVIYTASRNPPQPDSRGVVIRDTTQGGDALRGCEWVPAPIRSGAMLVGFGRAARLLLGGGLLLVLIALLVVAMPVRVRLGMGLPVLVGLVLLELPLVIHLGVTCTHNA